MGTEINSQITDENGDAFGEYILSMAILHGDIIQLESTGYIPSIANQKTKRSVRVIAILHLARPRYLGTIESKNDLTMSGGGDSSSEHSSHGQPSSSPVQNNTFGHVIVHGNAVFDAGTDVFGSVEAEGSVTGPSDLVHGTNVDGLPNTVSEYSNPPPIPDFPDNDLNDARTTNDNASGITPPTGLALEDIYDATNNILSVNGNNETVILAPGTYYFTKLELAGNNSEIIIQPEGEVTIFIEDTDPVDDRVFLGQ
jgi:hypothetical protein